MAPDQFNGSFTKKRLNHQVTILGVLFVALNYQTMELFSNDWIITITKQPARQI
jgi:hypothetical protein